MSLKERLETGEGGVSAAVRAQSRADRRTERHKCEVWLEQEGDHCILCDWRKERRVAVIVGS